MRASWGEAAGAAAEDRVAPAHAMVPCADGYMPSWTWQRDHPGATAEDAKTFYSDWASCQQWRSRQQSRLQRDWGLAECWQRSERLVAQRAVDSEAAIFLEQRETAYRNSCVAEGSAHTADGAEAELCQDALNAVNAADAAEKEAIAAQLVSDAAFATQLAAGEGAAAEAEDSTIVCTICCSEAELIPLSCSDQHKMCYACIVDCRGKCPFCRGRYEQ